MRFHELPVADARLIDMELHTDQRGFNARAWCFEEIGDAGIPTDLAQINVMGNHAKGTVRGFHWQAPPHAEHKIFRVTKGAIHDVFIDLRPWSPTFREWTSVELRAENFQMLYVPAGFGQGYQALTDDTEITYQVSSPYAPEAARGFRWNDPAFDIPWPLEVTVMSEKDRTWPDLDIDAVAEELAPFEGRL